jgi:hypothetical protein
MSAGVAGACAALVVQFLAGILPAMMALVLCFQMHKALCYCQQSNWLGLHSPSLLLLSFRVVLFYVGSALYQLT